MSQMIRFQNSIRPNMGPNMLSRFRGAMIGSAIGDAIGMPVETLSREVIKEKFGHIEGFMPKVTKKGQKPEGSWTDETYLSMLTAKSIIENQGMNIEDITNKYIEALNYDFGLAGTTRLALEQRKNGKDVIMKGRHAGAGSAARITPVALFGYRDLASLRTASEAVSRITHQDNDAVAGAVAVACSLRMALRGSLRVGTHAFWLNNIMTEMNSNLYYSFLLMNDLLHRGLETEDGIREIGTDGATMRIVPSALYAFMNTPSRFELSILAAVNAGGDTDTRAAIVGALSGAYNGIEGIPSKWVKKVQDHGIILRYADSLYNITNGTA